MTKDEREMSGSPMSSSDEEERKNWAELKSEEDKRMRDATASVDRYSVYMTRAKH